MTMHSDDDLTREERDALAAIPREHEVPPGLEDRVTAAVMTGRVARSEGRSLHRSWPGTAAAAVLCLAAGFAAGRATAAADPGTGADAYLLLLYGAAAASPEELTARAREYGAWAGEERGAGRMVSAARLTDARRVMGPASQAPPPGQDPVGFFIIRAGSPDEAASTASRCPHLKYGGTVSVRAIR
jgi:hypothetical protein